MLREGAAAGRSEPAHDPENLFRVVVMLEPIDGDDHVGSLAGVGGKDAAIRDAGRACGNGRDVQNMGPDIDPGDSASPSLGDFDGLGAGAASEIDHHLANEFRPNPWPKPHFDLAPRGAGTTIARGFARDMAADVPEELVADGATHKPRPDHVLSPRTRVAIPDLA